MTIMPRSQRSTTTVLRVLLAGFILILSQVASAEELRGRVVGITDGDTLTLLTEQREEVRIRLAAIDTPEGGQPYGSRAREVLSDLAFGKVVRVAVQDTDRNGRVVGRVYAGTLDVNAEMVRRGAAWVYRRYSDDPDLLRLEQAARTERRGLWGLPEAERVPPWEWRAAKRQPRQGWFPSNQPWSLPERHGAGATAGFVGQPEDV